MTIMIFVASVVSLLAAWHLQRITTQDSPNIHFAVRLNAVAALIVICFAFYSQYQNVAMSEKIRKIEIDLSVSENIAQRRIKILKLYSQILNSSFNTNSYIRYNKDINSMPVELRRTLAWKKVVEGSQVKALEGTKKSFSLLQEQALEIIDLSGRFPLRVPESTKKWANKTIKMKFDELPKYINAYDQTDESMKYAKELGEAFGSVIGEVIKAKKTLGG